jgi:aminoglycoside 2'-N-acetyltransferase I
MSVQSTKPFEIQVVHVSDLSETVRGEIVSLCKRAFDEDMGYIFTSFADSTHFLGYLGDRLVSHAMWVTRYLQAGEDPMLRTAYVEAVATRERFRGRGYGSAIMKRLTEEAQEFDLAALSPANHAFYERLGWEPWRGPLFVRTEDGLLASPADEEVMVYYLPKTPPLDLTASLSVEWREGEVW